MLMLTMEKQGSPVLDPTIACITDTYALAALDVTIYCNVDVDDGSPVLDPNITCVPDTYAPADIDATMYCNVDVDGGEEDADRDRDKDDSATQLGASFGLNDHNVSLQ